MSAQEEKPQKGTPEQRVRRGCLGMALILGAMSWVLIIQTGNLAWGLLLILVAALLLARRYLV